MFFLPLYYEGAGTIDPHSAVSMADYSIPGSQTILG
jgi:hypothetical protein